MKEPKFVVGEVVDVDLGNGQAAWEKEVVEEMQYVCNEEFIRYDGVTTHTGWLYVTTSVPEGAWVPEKFLRKRPPDETTDWDEELFKPEPVVIPLGLPEPA